MNVRIPLPSESSTVRPYRLASGLWIGISLVYVIFYLRVAVLDGRHPQALLLASAPLVQAIWTPLYIRWKGFANGADAAIQGAAAAVAIDGLVAAIFLLARTSFGDSDRLQLGYVYTVLLLGGGVGGAALGTLRWRILNADLEHALEPPVNGLWRRYMRSALLWAASVNMCVWPFKAARWAMNSSPDNFDLFAFLVGIAGLFLIAPVTALSPPLEAEGRRQLILKYLARTIPGTFLMGLLVVGAQLGPAYGVVIVILTIASPVLPIVWIPCLSWALLSGWSAPSSANISEARPARQPRQRLSDSTVVWLSATGQIGALLVGLLAAAPVSLGFHGVGCLNVYSTDAAEYWFWKAYKGFASEFEAGSRMVLRPSVDHSVCLIIEQKAMASLSDPTQVERGYAGAARSWFWLIDPEQWESDRTRQIRTALTRLLGRDFPSYADLQAWWERNNKHLVWSGTDELLEVHEPDLRDVADPYHYNLKHPAPPSSAVEDIRLHPWDFGPEPGGSSDQHQQFRSLIFDREARLRGLKLYVADTIQVLTGERERRAREFLRKSTRQDFATKLEWWNFLAQNDNLHPWRISSTMAQIWSAEIRIQLSGSAPGRFTIRVQNMQEDTGLSYSSLEDFLAWLENPENTRREEWDKARQLVQDLPDDRRPNSNVAFAMGGLKNITDQTFKSPEEWVQWWLQNNLNLVLSPEGRKLVTK